LNDPSDKFLADFTSDPNRFAFLIDESRPNKQGDQYAIFGLVTFRMADLVDAQAEWYQLATNPQYKELLKSDIKGQHLYGSIRREDLAAFRDFFEKWILKAVRVHFMFTSQKFIKLNSKTSLGKIRFVMADGTVKVAGPELQPIVIFVKDAANDLGVGANNVEVVIDESEQNSYGLASEGVVKSTDTFYEFNETHGNNKANVHCPSKFRLTITPDQSPNFQHALLFPDVVCYLANKYGLFEQGKSNVDTDLFHIQEVSVSKIVVAALNWRTK